MNKAVQFFKDWMLPLAIATGIGLYLFYHFTPVLKPYGAVLLTAVGIRLEVIGKTWILAGDKVVDVFSEVTGVKFSNAKIGEDILLVALSAGFAWICFGSPFGHGEEIVIREGTLILAALTGLCMKLTDPLVDKVFNPLLHE